MYCVKCMEALAAIPFFQGECMNFTIVIAVKYSKVFRRAIVDICTCKGDFGNSYFL